MQPQGLISIPTYYSKVSHALIENFLVGLSIFSGGVEDFLTIIDGRLGADLRKRIFLWLPDEVLGSMRMTTALGVWALMTQLVASFMGVVMESFWQAQLMRVEGLRVFAAS